MEKEEGVLFACVLCSYRHLNLYLFLSFSCYKVVTSWILKGGSVLGWAVQSPSVIAIAGVGMRENSAFLLRGQI